MQHIQETADTYPFLYYQRIFIKGYVALNVPFVMPIKSEAGDGYIYVRRHLKGLRIRDLNNRFKTPLPDPTSPLVEADPTRGLVLSETVLVETEVKGRRDKFTWAYTKDDLPRIANTETYTEFLACVPLRNRAIPTFTLVAAYFSTFIDWYRMITGDISMTGPNHWNSYVPMHSECLLDVSAYRDKSMDELVADLDPNGFEPRIFHFDVEPNEAGSVNQVTGGMAHEERIAHYLATGHVLPEVHRRFADILHLAQETKDWALVPLCMYPVFEQYLDEFMDEVAKRSATFNLFLASKREKPGVTFVGQRIKWLPAALRGLGFDPDSVAAYLNDIDAANRDRVQVVHYNRKPAFGEAADFARIMTNTVFLCETALQRDPPYVVAIKKASTLAAQEPTPFA